MCADTRARLLLFLVLSKFQCQSPHSSCFASPRARTTATINNSTWPNIYDTTLSVDPACSLSYNPSHPSRRATTHTHSARPVTELAPSLRVRLLSHRRCTQTALDCTFYDLGTNARALVKPTVPSVLCDHTITTAAPLPYQSATPPRPAPSLSSPPLCIAQL